MRPRGARLNPVLRREGLERWRGRRAMLVLTVYLAILGAILYGLYQLGLSFLGSQGPNLFFGGPDPAAVAPMLGRFLFEGLLFFLMLLVLFITPGYAASQIAGERERRTLSLLQLSLLTPRMIVLGKLGASTAWIGLLVLAALPFGAVTFFLGGVDALDLVLGVGAILVVGAAVAAMALGISSLTRRTTPAIVITYALVLALTLGTGFLAIVETVVRLDRGGDVRPLTLFLNPFLPLAGAADAADPTEFGIFELPSPLTPFAAALPRADFQEFGPPGPPPGPPPMIDRPMPAPLIEQTAEAVPIPAPAPPVSSTPEPTGTGSEVSSAEPSRLAVAGDGPAVVAQAPDAFGPRRRWVWLWSLGIYAGLGALSLLVAVRRLRTVAVAPRGRKDREQAEDG